MAGSDPGPVAVGVASRRHGEPTPLPLRGLPHLGLRRRRLAHLLAGGEMQRVAVARAVAHRPALVLADEPTGNLDEANAVATIEALRAAVKREGAAGLLVTHSAVAAASADRVLRLMGRRLGPA